MNHYDKRFLQCNLSSCNTRHLIFIFPSEIERHDVAAGPIATHAVHLDCGFWKHLLYRNVRGLGLRPEDISVEDPPSFGVLSYKKKVPPLFSPPGLLVLGHLLPSLRKANKELHHARPHPHPHPHPLSAAMASSSIALTVMFGFTAALCCLQLLGADTTTTTQSGLARLAAASLVPAVLAALTLTPLLAFARVHARAEAEGALVSGLAKATLLAGTVALVAAAVVQLGADGHLDRGRDDVARLNVK